MSMSAAGARDPQGGGPSSVLFTGGSGLVAQRMVATILGTDAGARVTLLSGEREVATAQGFVDALPAAERGRVRVVLGAVDALDLGMSGSDYREVVEATTAIHHMAGMQDMRANPDTLRRVRVDGTRRVLELAAACPRLTRLCHWSSVHVAGKRKGVVLEEDLDEGQSFSNQFEELQCAAEKLARAAQQRLPVTVLRPGVIIGDSRTGAIDRFDGPYYLMVLIVRNTTQVALPLPGRGSAPLHLVPIDFVIDAAHALSQDERAAGKTYHLVDPNPLPARRVYELVAEHAQTVSPRGFIPQGITRTLMRAPGIERLSRAPRAFMESFDHQVFFNSRHAQALLGEHGISCPPFDSYVHNLLRFLRVALDERPPAATGADARNGDEDEDPFD
jgi:thioester reductase-like protein